jgi:hypothetical protein
MSKEEYSYYVNGFEQVKKNDKSFKCYYCGSDNVYYKETFLKNKTSINKCNKIGHTCYDCADCRYIWYREF